MSSDEELDYMSPEFLKNCVKEDIRPGLIQDHSHRRYHNIHKKKQVIDEKYKHHQRPKKLVESKTREEGLKESTGGPKKLVESKVRGKGLKEGVGGDKRFGELTQANASSDDELDYMSNEFLESCVKEDIRPGLIHNHSHRRYHDIHKKKQVTDEENRQRNKPKKVVELERREEGLKEAIGGDNKGFALLQKMGYKPGTAIGKSGTGRTEPVPINIKAGREGLGRETALKEIAEAKLAIRRRLALQREKECNADNYRARMMKKAAERQIEADLRKSQKICENLDRAMCIDEPAETFFWPTSSTKSSEPEDEEEDEDVDENPKEEDSEDQDEEDEEEEEDSQEIEFEPPEKLEILTSYLRRTYNYCIWCAVQYDDEKDLQESCPGPTRDDH